MVTGGACSPPLDPPQEDIGWAGWTVGYSPQESRRDCDTAELTKNVVWWQGGRSPPESPRRRCRWAG